MGDLIRREELLTSQFVHTECYLQANKDRHYDVYKKGWNDALQAAYDNAPAVDAVEVVRCESCDYWHRSNECFSYGMCTKVWMNRDATFYCKSGERKTDG